ncbi:MAG: molybdate ABC transporter substrate-binding protein, partial [Candidatus Omnitrophica bacterium]|nr:molybdate ABC transporter substrate-binding protein [Candidatus Omnitrophota bacterium]
MMKKFLFLAAVILFFPVFVFAEDLTIAVAANVQYTFEEIQTLFEKKTGIVIKPVIGSSGKFVAQIQNGAPFHLLLSADMKYPNILDNEGLTYNDPRIYAYGTLVLWTFLDVDLSKGIKILADSHIQKIALANPETAPYGLQAVNVLKKNDFYSAVSPKIVYGESIAQVNQFVSSQAADIGFTSKSTVLAPNMKDQGRWVEIDPNAYDPIAQ